MYFFFFDNYQSILEKRISAADFEILEKYRKNVPLLSLLLDAGVIRKNKGDLSFSLFGNWLFRPSNMSPFFLLEQNERGGLDKVLSYSGSPFSAFINLLEEIEVDIPHYLSRASIENRRIEEVGYELIKASLSGAIQNTDIMNGSIRITKSLAQSKYIIEFIESRKNNYSRQFANLFTQLGLLPKDYRRILKEAAQKNAYAAFSNPIVDGMNLISLPFATSIRTSTQTDSLSFSEQKVLSYIAKTNKAVHRNDLIQYLGMPDRSASRVLVNLNNKGLIKRIGDKGRKDSFYKLAKESIKS